MLFARPLLVLGLMGVVAAAGWSPGDAYAQQIYRFTGPDGRITFTDKAPLEPTITATTARVVTVPAGSGLEALPFELRQTATRYPVTFYTGPGCGPCAGGRALLASRGVPYTEKTVTSAEDIEALKRLAGGTATLPFLTIGSQQLRGYSEVEWVQFLDAAGYPKTSKLPPNFAPSPATPLVVAQEPQRPAPRPAEPARAAAPAPVQPPPDNPSGIRF